MLNYLKTHKFNKMKKIISIGLLLTLSVALVFFYSCNKKNENIASDKISTTKKTKLPIGIRAIFTWDEWGRKKFNCRKNGLCYFRLNDLIVSGSHYTEVQTASNGDLFVEINVDSNIEYEDSTTNLYVDDDITSNNLNGLTLVLPKGTYSFISTIGSSGGYHLPLLQN